MVRLAWRPDVVWVVAPAFFCATGAWLAARHNVGENLDKEAVLRCFEAALVKLAMRKRIYRG